MATSDQQKQLTPREIEVLELLPLGLTNEQIGKVLNISAQTAKHHVAALLRKLGAGSRAEAVALAAAASATPSGDRDALFRAGPPGIAVLQLECSDPDPLSRQLADGIADDLITRLSRRWYPVIARCSSFGLPREAQTDARAIGSAIGARYLVEGSFTQLGQRVRLNVRLVDVVAAHVVWAERFDHRCDQLFDVLEELSQAIMEGVFAAALSHVGQQLASAPSARLQPWQIAIRGMWHLWRGTPEQNAEARTLFAQALALEPDQRLSLYGMALTHQREIYEQWSADPEASVEALAQVTGRFLGSWPEDSWALLMSAYTALYRGDRQGALVCVQQSLEFEPSLLGGHSLRGQLLAMDGQSERAVVEIGKALRLSPRTPERWIYECVMALAYFAGEHYAQAVDWGSRSVLSNRSGAMAYGVLASAYYFLGERDQARNAAQRFKELAPLFSSARFQPMIASTRPEIAARYLEGLNGANAC